MFPHFVLPLQTVASQFFNHNHVDALILPFFLYIRMRRFCIIHSCASEGILYINKHGLIFTYYIYIYIIIYIYIYIYIYTYIYSVLLLRSLSAIATSLKQPMALGGRMPLILASLTQRVGEEPW
jgi:hypothetical protein